MFDKEDQIIGVEGLVWDEARSQVLSQLSQYTWDSIWFKVWIEVDNIISDNIWDQVDDKIWEALNVQ